MQKDTDILGAWDETELVELSEADVHGGTGPACVATGLILGITAIQAGVATAVSAAFCPTTKCTSRC
ncbi:MULTISPECIES: class II lanthipeptide, LchA2/BrtA2 family [Streptomyces]|uniref:Class II lanthipeptide, LchA2/BrtA2 family n=1 Tax=Streptomyces lonegramiae TaxID=3075524 RepID=A0ABU2XU15_9ACTN|nr:class II lanthipeptide, LchA2/BrtA2 family [Streptomyces sp. DSM 41529]MDT0549071.1 class II lanthipeptide, LchA2/BrtA2 family [Streptomyces sp. DSM 41529]